MTRDLRQSIVTGRRRDSWKAMGRNQTVSADVAVWGRIPPPYGGMSTHLARLVPLLEEAGISSQMYSLSGVTPEHPAVEQVAGRRLRWLLRLFVGKTESVHYVLGGRLTTRALAGLLALLRKRKVVLRIGGRSLEDTGVHRAFYSRLLTRFALRQADAVIGVNAAICKLAIRLGAKPSRVHHVPGFIPPRDDGLRAAKELRDFAETRSPVFLASGQVATGEREEIYGVDLLLDMMPMLVQAMPNAGLILWIYDASHRAYDRRSSLREKVRQRSLENHVIVHEGREELWPAIKLCDVFLRPTTTDGDSNAVREAMYFGKAVVASDCVVRPQPVRTFSTGDVKALTAAAVEAALNPNRDRELQGGTEQLDNGRRIVSLFEQLLES